MQTTRAKVKKPVKEEEIQVDLNAPLLEVKTPVKKAETISEIPHEKADTPVIKNIDERINELLAKTANKTKTEATGTFIHAPEKMEIASPLHKNPAINNAPLYQRPNLSHESLLADIAYREVVKQVDDVGIALGKDLTKNKELADDWRTHIHALDKYIKSLEGLPWRKMLSYSACFLLVGTFIWKMGALRVLPDFLGTAIKLIPTTGISSTTMQETVAELPKPSVTSTINAMGTFLQIRKYILFCSQILGIIICLFYIYKAQTYEVSWSLLTWLMPTVTSKLNNFLSMTGTYILIIPLTIIIISILIPENIPLRIEKLEANDII